MKMSVLLILVSSFLRFSSLNLSVDSKEISYQNIEIYDTLKIDSNLFFHRNYRVVGKDTLIKSSYFSIFVDSVYLIHGLFRYYTSQGNLSFMSSYEYGKKNGFELWFFHNTGRVSNQFEYKNDTLINQVIIYYENGNIEAIGSCVNGLSWKSGKWRYYYENGQLKSEGNYILIDSKGNILNTERKNITTIFDFVSVKIGEWTNYDERGKFISLENHKTPQISNIEIFDPTSR